MATISPRNIALRFNPAEMKKYGVSGTEAHIKAGSVIPENLEDHPYVLAVLKDAGRPKFNTEARVPNPKEPTKADAPPAALTEEDLNKLTYEDLKALYAERKGEPIKANTAKKDIIAALLETPPAK